MNKQQIETKLLALRPVLGQDGSNEIVLDEKRNELEIGYRDGRFFTARPGEQDDDHASFTEEKRVMKILAEAFPENKFWISTSEKNWFYVTVAI